MRELARRVHACRRFWYARFYHISQLLVVWPAGLDPIAPHGTHGIMLLKTLGRDLAMVYLAVIDRVGCGKEAGEASVLLREELRR